MQETSGGIGRRRGRPRARTHKMEDSSIYRNPEYDIDIRESLLKGAFYRLEAAGVPAYIKDAADSIRPEFPDVEVIKLVDIKRGEWGGSEIRWNFITLSEDQFGKTFKYSSVAVSAHDFSEGEVIHVSSRKHMYAFTKDKWSRNPEIVKDALTEAIKDPKEKYSFDE